MIINVPEMKYLLENIEDEEVQLFIISLGVIWRDSMDIKLIDKKERMSQFLDLMAQGIEDE